MPRASTSTPAASSPSGTTGTRPAAARSLSTLERPPAPDKDDAVSSGLDTLDRHAGHDLDALRLEHRPKPLHHLRIFGPQKRGAHEHGHPGSEARER